MVPKITQVSLLSPSHPCMKKTRWIYDVLSFRGEDTQDHLYAALHQRGFAVLMDDLDLDGGKAILLEL